MFIITIGHKSGGIEDELVDAHVTKLIYKDANLNFFEQTSIFSVKKN